MNTPDLNPSPSLNNPAAPIPRDQPIHWLDRPETVARLWRGFLFVLATTVGAEFFVTLHPTFAVERLFGFSAAFGFFACALMIIGAKLLGAWLKRPDDYYASADDGDD